MNPHCPSQWCLAAVTQRYPVPAFQVDGLQAQGKEHDAEDGDAEGEMGLAVNSCAGDGAVCPTSKGWRARQRCRFQNARVTAMSRITASGVCASAAAIFPAAQASR